MVYSSEVAEKLATTLLSIGAIKLNVKQPFTWASGLKSPIYCDNRSTLSFPEVRKEIKSKLAEGILQRFPDTQLIAGVATAGIPHGALVADLLGLPFIYVRSSAKKHGLGNLIEGRYHHGERTVLIEDLISTGGSSLSAAHALREAGLEVIGLAAIFSYGFKKAEDAFREFHCPYFTLSDYAHLIASPAAQNLVGIEAMQSLREWRISPENWA